MSIEIPFLQRFTLFLSHPATAAAVVLAAFLVFAGFGARHSARLAPGVRWPFAAITVLALLYAAALPDLLTVLMGFAQGWKILITMLLVAPLAFCMGMPFPLGLAAVAARRCIVGALGLGHQWLCLGGGDPARHPAVDPLRAHAGGVDSRWRSMCSRPSSFRMRGHSEDYRACASAQRLSIPASPVTTLAIWT